MTKQFTKAVGGAEEALKLLAAAYVGSKLTGGALPPWLAGLIAYGLYLYNDRENIEGLLKDRLITLNVNLEIPCAAWVLILILGVEEMRFMAITFSQISLS